MPPVGLSFFNVETTMSITGRRVNLRSSMLAVSMRSSLCGSVFASSCHSLCVSCLLDGAPDGTEAPAPRSSVVWSGSKAAFKASNVIGTNALPRVSRRGGIFALSGIYVNRGTGALSIRSPEQWSSHVRRLYKITHLCGRTSRACERRLSASVTTRSRSVEGGAISTARPRPRTPAAPQGRPGPPRR
jgi:hypothetical protein